MMKRMLAATALAVVAMAPAMSDAAEMKLPQTFSTTAYDVGSTGYNQLTAIGSALKNEYGVNLRILPGKNDVARIRPLLEGKVDFAASGSDAVYAQEGIFVFGQKGWGPAHIHMTIMGVTSGANAVFAVTRDSGIRSIQDLKGKRIAVIKGGPTSEQLGTALLAFGGLGWDDVVRVEQAGFAAQAQALLEGQVDAITTATTTPNNLKQDAAPAGLHFIETPFADTEGWKRLQAVVPWMFQNRAMTGPSIPPEGQEMSATPYPILLALHDKDSDVVYSVVRAFVETYDDYKDAAPGTESWALERQKFADAFLPVHEGAVRYYKEIDFWTPAFESRREEMLKRQEILQQAWSDYSEKNGNLEGEEFEKGWMEARSNALEEAGLVTIVTSW